MNSVVAIESLIILCARVGLFWFCKRHVLQALHPDLRHSTTSSRPDVEHDVELIPLPSTSTSSSAKSEDTSSHARISQYCFSICFEECCILFGLALAQALDLLHVETCRLHWTVSLTILTSTTLLIIPLFQCLFLTYPSGSLHPPTKKSLIVPLSSYSLYLFLLSQIPLPASSDTHASKSLSRLAVLGVSILGLLSGFGAIQTCFWFWESMGRSSWKEISDSDLARAQSSLDQIREDLVRRRSELEKRLQSVASGKTTPSGWTSRIFGNSSDREISDMNLEIDGLESLEYQMSLRLEGMKGRKQRMKYSKTFSGKLWNSAGRLFALYCAFRILVSVYHLLIPSPSAIPSPVDDVDQSTHLIEQVTSISPDTLSFLTNQFNLTMIGFIVLNSLRRVLTGVNRALRVTSRSLGTSIKLLIIAQLMTTYLFSTLLQLRSSLSASSSPSLFDSLPQFSLFGTLFDATFVLSSAICFAWLGAKGLQKGWSGAGAGMDDWEVV